ncbi:MAG: M14 family zinc carboxypeptidase, partial [Bacteroidota bacterium]
MRNIVEWFLGGESLYDHSTLDAAPLNQHGDRWDTGTDTERERIKPTVEHRRSMIRIANFFARWVICLLPLVVSAQEPPKRTLLLQLQDVPQEKMNKGLLVFDEYRRDAVVSYVRGTVMLLTTRAEAEVLRERGFHFTLVKEDTNQLNLYKRAIYGETMKMPAAYYTYERIIEEVDALATQYPKTIKKILIGQTSQGKRNIYAVKISNDVEKEQDKPSIMFDGCHHSDEVMGAEICTAIIQELVEKYNKEPQVTDWVNRYEIFVVPVVNVDGHTVVT